VAAGAVLASIAVLATIAAVVVVVLRKRSSKGNDHGQAPSRAAGPEAPLDDYDPAGYPGNAPMYDDERL
jgi:hypothetical protein